MIVTIMNTAAAILAVLACLVSIFFFFSKKVDRRVYFIFTLLCVMLLPKVNLITVPGSSTGIRGDDLLLFLFLVLNLKQIYTLTLSHKRLTVLALLMGALAGIGLLSTAVGMLTGTVAAPVVSVLASLRRIEYFVCFFLGYFALRGLDAKKILRLCCHVAVGMLPLCLLQRAGLFGTFRGSTYIEPDGGVAATFNGGYEYAAVCCLLMGVILLLILRRGQISLKGNLYAFFAYVALFFQVFASTSRTGLAVCLLISVLEFILFCRKQESTWICLCCICLAAVLLIALLPSLRDRFLYLDPAEMANAAVEQIRLGDYDAFQVDKIPPNEKDLEIYAGGVDLSFYVRMARWGIALNGFGKNPVLGYGPGEMPTVDGSLVKLLSEGGILSFVLFGFILFLLCREGKRQGQHQVIFAVLSLLCFSIFIDVFDASRVMCLFWVIAASTYAACLPEVKEESPFAFLGASSELPRQTGDTLPKCMVMLCTYRGAENLREQIDSVLNQTGVITHIRVSDDCSPDNTAEILKEYKEKYPDRFDYWVNEKNKRFTYNFLDLFFSTRDTDYDYYAFCDQDDVWLPEKLSRAVTTIHSVAPHPKGTLYCSNLTVVNEHLQKTDMQETPEAVAKMTKTCILFENIATGCTVVMDRTFHHHAMSHYPENIELHDYWLFLVAVYTAQAVYDTDAYILYRQHSGNQIGTNKRKWTLANIRRAFTGKPKQLHLMRELLRGYGDEIDPAYVGDIQMVRDYHSHPTQWARLILCPRFRQRRNNLILRIKLLIRKV